MNIKPVIVLYIGAFIAFLVTAGHLAEYGILGTIERVSVFLSMLSFFLFLLVPLENLIRNAGKFLVFNDITYFVVLSIVSSIPVLSLIFGILFYYTFGPYNGISVESVAIAIFFGTNATWLTGMIRREIDREQKIWNIRHEVIVYVINLICYAYFYSIIFPVF